MADTTDTENNTTKEEPNNESSVDIFDLSDEEIMSKDDSFLDQTKDDETADNEENVEIEEEEENTNSKDIEKNKDISDEQDKDNTDNKIVKDEDIYQEKKEKDDTIDKVTTDQDKEKDGSIDYKAIYDQIFAPFKANGTQMQVKSPDDVIRLMQMGANYPQKMGALKPHLKIVKLLEKNDLLDLDKLNYLIDLNNKDSNAIGKLITDSGIDPLEINTENPDYVPTQRKVDDIELELDEVLDEIKLTPSYNKTINVITNNWDSESRNVLANTPQLIKLINEHMELGIYDEIAKEMAYGKSLNKYPGINDLDLYSKIGDKLNAEGKFDKYYKTKSFKKKPSSKIDNSVRKKQKKAAAPTRRNSSNASKNLKFDPLVMSDEEIMKIDETQLDKYILK